VASLIFKENWLLQTQRMPILIALFMDEDLSLSIFFTANNGVTHLCGLLCRRGKAKLLLPETSSIVD